MHSHPQPHATPTTTHNPNPCAQHPATTTPAQARLMATGPRASRHLSPVPCNPPLPSSSSPAWRWVQKALSAHPLLLPHPQARLHGSPSLGAGDRSRVPPAGLRLTPSPLRRGRPCPPQTAQLPALPPPADKAQPDKAATSLAGPRRAWPRGRQIPLLQPPAEPDTHPQPSPACAGQRLRAAKGWQRCGAGHRRESGGMDGEAVGSLHGAEPAGVRSPGSGRMHTQPLK